jgi:hypothetical protein
VPFFKINDINNAQIITIKNQWDYIKYDAMTISLTNEFNIKIGFYYENKEKCYEQTKTNQKRYRELYKYVKEIVKQDKLEHLSEEEKQHLKELLCL